MRLYNITKHKTSIKGYWIDKGKIYKDNISIIEYKDRQEAGDKIKEIFESGELAIFYTLGNRAIIEDREGKKRILKYRQEIHKNTLTKYTISKLLNQFDGFTVYHKKDRYIIEIWR